MHPPMYWLCCGTGTPACGLAGSVMPSWQPVAWQFVDATTPVLWHAMQPGGAIVPPGSCVVWMMATSVPWQLPPAAQVLVLAWLAATPGCTATPVGWQPAIVHDGMPGCSVLPAWWQEPVQPGMTVTSGPAEVTWLT